MNAIIGTMHEDRFDVLDRFLDSGDRNGGLDFLIDQFRTTGEFRLFFEAKLMKKRLELGMPLIQTESSSEFPPEVRGDYDQAMITAARETGTLALEKGDIVQAWPYFRAIGEQKPIFDAIDKVQPGESAEQIINIAFAEGVHPVKGLELILNQHGMCRAITAFGMYPDKSGRAKCINLLVRSLHAEVIERIARTIEAQEGTRPAAASIPELIGERDWLFGEYDYYVDTSHLMSLLAYSLEVTEPRTLELFHELCAYGKRLSPMFQSRGQSPFENPFVDYDEYVLAVTGVDVEERIAHFRKKVADSDPYEVGTAPAQLLVNLLVRLGRFDEAVQVSIERLSEEEPSELSCPSTLQLCNLAKDYERLKQLARDRGDVLSYIAAKS
jgi:hypothetical protein